MILDCEVKPLRCMLPPGSHDPPPQVLMVDNETGRPLPFGTLGIHKVSLGLYTPCRPLDYKSLYTCTWLQKSAFKDASCCLFIFDIVHFNGETLLDRYDAGLINQPL